MTFAGCLSKPRSKAINSSLTIISGWSGSGLGNQFLVWVQDIFATRFESLISLLAVGFASLAQRLKRFFAYGADHFVELANQGLIHFLERGPTAHHQIPGRHGELAGDGSH